MPDLCGPQFIEIPSSMVIHVDYIKQFLQTDYLSRQNYNPKQVTKKLTYVVTFSFEKLCIDLLYFLIMYMSGERVVLIDFLTFRDLYFLIMHILGKRVGFAVIFFLTLWQPTTQLPNNYIGTYSYL